MKRMQLSGLVFGRLAVLGAAGIADYRSLWECACYCGKSVIVSGKDLKSGNTRSCGCLRRENQPNRTHGKTETREYRIWTNIKTRCLNVGTPAYKHYGGRGIRICKRWELSFEAFLTDMGLSNGLSIERRDNEKGYSPGNCYWATQEQQQNNRRNNRLYELNGEALTIRGWSNKCGVSYSVIAQRLNRLKWPLARAISTPVYPMLKNYYEVRK